VFKFSHIYYTAGDFFLLFGSLGWTRLGLALALDLLESTRLRLVLSSSSPAERHPCRFQI
jgi:hypothetical protein